MAFLASVANLHPNRHAAWTLELLATSLRLTNFTEMRLKQALSCRRPIEYSPQVQPMILTPGHGTLPMGHAAETFMAAFVLWNLLRQPMPGCRRTTSPYGDPSWGAIAEPGGAGGHQSDRGRDAFPGRRRGRGRPGLTLGQYFVNCCQAAPQQYAAWTFDGPAFPDPTMGAPPPNDGDFYWTELFNFTAARRCTAQPNADGVREIQGPNSNVNPSSLLHWLWKQALGEWT